MYPDDDVALERVEFFRALGPPLLGRVRGLVREQRLPAHATLFVEGQPADALWAVRRGGVRLYKTSPDGRVTTLETLAPGEIFGALSTLDADRYPASAESLVDVVALAGWAVALVGILTFPRAIARGAVVVAGPLALLPAWLILLFVHAAPAIGPKLALLAMALVWAADIGAYVTGRLIGRVKLAPQVSPGKTWEGVGGGVLLALAVAWVASAWLDLAPLPLLAVAVPTALVSVIGDLTVSMLKRNIGLKDTGRLLPGHGGVMDRIDGLIAAVPAYAAGLRLAGLVS